MIGSLAKFISNLLNDSEIEDRHYARAASLIDELADRVRAVRDALSD
jgi:hypothetical protein